MTRRETLGELSWPQINVRHENTRGASGEGSGGRGKEMREGNTDGSD